MFALGTMAVSVAYVPFAFVQAMGRPDLTAKRHMFELPFYFVLSYFAIRTFGIFGAAVVWSLWAVIDLILMNRIFLRELGKSGSSEQPNSWFGLCVIFGLTIGIGYLGPTWAQALTAVVAPSTFLYWGWKRWLYPDDRVLLCGFLPPSVRALVQ
jgi:O-antigen/teichoic acid export membrane protein